MARTSNVEPWLTEEGLNLIRHWKRNDLKEAEIAERVGIAPSTLSLWKKTHAEIAEALKKGLEDCVADAEEALISKFKTRTATEERIETWEEPWVDENGTLTTKKKTHKMVIKKTIEADTTAIIFYLKSKAGWRDNANITTLSVEDLSPLAELLNVEAKHN